MGESTPARGYPGHESLDQAAALGVTVYAPVPKPLKSDAPATAAPWPTGGPAWPKTRPRRSTRSGLPPPHRGLDDLLVRGAGFALTYDILRYISISA